MICKSAKYSVMGRGSIGLPRNEYDNGFIDVRVTVANVRICFDVQHKKPVLWVVQIFKQEETGWKEGDKCIQHE
jgi:hypothetical protein